MCNTGVRRCGSDCAARYSERPTANVCKWRKDPSNRGSSCDTLARESEGVSFGAMYLAVGNAGNTQCANGGETSELLVEEPSCRAWEWSCHRVVLLFSFGRSNTRMGWAACAAMGQFK